MIRQGRGSLKTEERLDGAVWVLRFKVTRDFDHKRVERTRVIGPVRKFPTEEQAFTEAERLGLYGIDVGGKREKLLFATLAEFFLQELKRMPTSKKRKPKAQSTIEDRERIVRKRLLPRFANFEALKIRPSEIKRWLESVQDEEDLENSTIAKIRNVMHLIYSVAQANDLIPRTQEANPLNFVTVATTTDYEAILVTPQQAWDIICRMQPFERLLTLLIAVTGLRIGEVLALRWKHIDWGKLRIRVLSNFVRGKFGEPKSAASKRPVVLHPLIMGLLENWRKTTAYAGAEDFIFASDRLKGKRPRVPNMLVEDHLRPAAKQVIEIPDSQRFGFHNLRHALTSFLVEIGTDSKTIQDMLRWSDPSILLKVYAHSRMDKRMEAQAKMIAAMGLNEKTARQLIQ